MHIKNKLPLIYIINECAEKDKETGKLYIKPIRLRWIISYANFISASNYEYNIFDIEILKELTEDRINQTINDILKCDISKKEIYNMLSKTDIEVLNKAKVEYLHNQKFFWDLKDEWTDFFSSIKKWFK